MGEERVNHGGRGNAICTRILKTGELEIYNTVPRNRADCAPLPRPAILIADAAEAAATTVDFDVSSTCHPIAGVQTVSLARNTRGLLVTAIIESELRVHLVCPDCFSPTHERINPTMRHASCCLIITCVSVEHWWRPLLCTGKFSNAKLDLRSARNQLSPLRLQLRAAAAARTLRTWKQPRCD